MSQNIGISSISRYCKYINLGVSAVARNINSGFIGVEGLCRPFIKQGLSLFDGNINNDNLLICKSYTSYTTSISGTLTPTDAGDYLTLSASKSTIPYCSLISENAIDITDYSILFITLLTTTAVTNGGNGSLPRIGLYPYISTLNPSNITGYINTTFTTSTTKITYELDISSITGEMYPYLMTYSYYDSNDDENPTHSLFRIYEFGLK